MTGEWDGVRDEAADKGITFASSFVCDIPGDVSGGMHRAARYDHSMGWDINFDLEKFFLDRRLSIKAGIYYNGAVLRDQYSDINGGSYAVTGLPQKKRVGDYNVYLHADRMLYREKGTVDNSLTALTVTTIGPDNVNKFPFFIMAGLIYKGLVIGTRFGVTF